jgi:hypothetical protein
VNLTVLVGPSGRLLTFEGEFSDVTSSYGGKGVVRYTQ